MGQGHAPQPPADPPPKAEAAVELPGASQDAAAVALELLLLSGERLARLRVPPASTGVDIRNAVADLLPMGVKMKELVHGGSGQVVSPTSTLAQLGLQSGSVLQVATKKSAFVARDAGSEAVNGFYFRAEERMNNAPCFTNDAGTLLFRDASPTRLAHWSFSRGGGEHHFYRAASSSLRPPTQGWSVNESCFGVLPVPQLAAMDDDPDNQAVDVDAATCSRSTSSTQSLESTSSSRVGPDQSLELEFLQLSGETLARLSVGSRWTGRDVRAALQKLLPEGQGIEQLITEEGCVFEFAATVKSLGLTENSQLHVVVRQCDYIVFGAVPEVVNGCYFRERRRFNEAPCFTNEAGTLLFRYRFRNGAYFWYFSQKGRDLDQSEGDYFRVKTTVPYPPEHGWTASKCPLGSAGDLPIVVRWCAEGEGEGGEPPDDEGTEDEASLEDEAALEDEVLGRITAGL